VCVRCGNKLPKPGALEISPKSRLAVALLAIFLGFFGVHRFYLDKSASAVIMLVLGIAGWCTMWLLGAGLLFLIAVYLWALVDFVVTITGRMQDGAERAVKNW
jgi:TM2 domain-containing membrane protein YozV